MPDLFELPPPPVIAMADSEAKFPVGRIFCVGQNYAAHARELGFEPQRDAPIWFTKSPAAVCLSGSTIAYPPGTENCHYEVELVVAVGKQAFRIGVDDALSVVIGYGVGLDLTRRDLQNKARGQGHPWDTGKDFENAAVLAPLTPAPEFGVPERQGITLTRNGTIKQQASLTELIWSVPELIADLSRMYHLAPGDLIFTGTPAGVGPIAPGDRLVGSIDGLTDLTLTIGEAE
ncbi:MAG: fumarylacetoacetate hydrolase family protein [Novosphingobium sp.]|nr:fumarylacetoacetate hydrolase family protein [Novosphingobium sp.]